MELAEEQPLSPFAAAQPKTPPKAPPKAPAAVEGATSKGFSGPQGPGLAMPAGPVPPPHQPMAPPPPLAMPPTPSSSAVRSHNPPWMVSECMVHFFQQIGFTFCLYDFFGLSLKCFCIN